MNFFVRVNIKAVFFSDFGNSLRRLFDIVTALFIESENNILGCGKYIYKLKMLMYHTDFIVECVPRRADNGFFSVYENLTLVGIINTRDHIHKRGFTASVLAEQRKNFALIRTQINIVVCDNRAKSFSDAF